MSESTQEFPSVIPVHQTDLDTHVSVLVGQVCDNPVPPLIPLSEMMPELIIIPLDDSSELLLSA
eukprot:2564300-Ditylum_brightwellii.AAC.1